MDETRLNLHVGYSTINRPSESPAEVVRLLQREGRTAPAFQRRQDTRVAQASECRVDGVEDRGRCKKAPACLPNKVGASAAAQEELSGLPAVEYGRRKRQQNRNGTRDTGVKTGSSSFSTVLSSSRLLSNVGIGPRKPRTKSGHTPLHVSNSDLDSD